MRRMTRHEHAEGAIPPEPNASDEPHDVLAAEEFAIPAPEAAWHAGPVQLPPDTSWGHYHENMQEVWLNVWGNVCALISGEGVVHGEYGDLINANEERWHRATSCPNTGRSIRMAITPRSKEGQVHYFQIDQPPGN